MHKFIKEVKYYLFNQFMDDIKNIYKMNIISKVHNFEYLAITKPKIINTSTQTEFKKENENNENNESEKDPKNKKSRKNDTDLIRIKLFNYFNNMLFNWIQKSINHRKYNIHIIQYHSKINKNTISTIMNKYLYEVFLQENDSKIIDTIKNELLKEKLNSKYKTIYDYFISPKNSVELLQKSKNFWKNFYFLEDYLEELKEKENDIYINRMKIISLEYNKWLNNKVYFFKKK